MANAEGREAVLVVPSDRRRCDTTRRYVGERAPADDRDAGGGLNGYTPSTSPWGLASPLPHGPPSAPNLSCQLLSWAHSVSLLSLFQEASVPRSASVLACLASSVGGL